MPRPIDNKGTYLPALDGLLAIAVAAVVAYHLGADQVPGGLLGVGIFFTLSGFLITGILRSTFDRTGGFDLKHFWLRRARRLLPAVVLVLVVVIAVTALSNPDELGVRTAESGRRPLLREQLDDDRPGRLLLRPVQRPGAARPPLVAGGRGAVLRLLAAHRLGPGHARCAGRWDRVGAGHRSASPSLSVRSPCGVIATPGVRSTPGPTRAPDTRAGGLLVGAALGDAVAVRPSCRRDAARQRPGRHRGGRRRRGGRHRAAADP